jgi:site-specific recombinase XerC
MNVHLFRHFAAYLFLKAHPGDYESVRILLGHRSIMTVIKFYTGLEHAEVFRRYDAVLDRYRSPQPGGQDGQK